MIDFQLKTHTVILLVGPSGCGKTHFSKNHLIPALKDWDNQWKATTNIQYLSSDDLRRELLGDPTMNYDKNTPKMMAVSEQAFDLLYKKLELVTSYPVNAEIVIVDTTGLNKGFRDKITAIAKNANYNTCCVVFAYKNREDYQKYLDETHNMTITFSQLKRLNRETMGELRKKDFDSYLYIKKKDFSDIAISVVDAQEYASHFLPHHLEYPVIGDIHGCYDELMAMLEQLRFKVEDGKIVDKPSAKKPIIVGDWIDGDLDGVEKVINFFFENMEHFRFITGNHEHFVYRYYKKDLDPKSLPPQEVIDSFFPTIHLLESNPLLAEKFCLIKERSKEFLIGNNFIVTHAPCEESALGKMTSSALRQQRNFRYPQRQKDESTPAYSQRFETALSFLKTSAAVNKPIHIFGHCRVKNVARVKNKIGIDTGAIQGNRLTAATVVGPTVYFNSIPSKKPVREDLPEVFTKKDAATAILPDIDLTELDHKELGRIKWAAKNKVNYVSGTMSPSDKDMDKCRLETISQALNYFANQNVNEVVLQTKFMGSRAELFLNCKDISKSYTTTRRGYLIDHVALSEAYQAVLNKVEAWAIEQDFEWLLLDCELMPWYALGKGLIEAQYNPYQFGISSEISLLKETGFESMLQKLIQEFEAVGYAKLSSQMPKETLRQQLTSHKCSTYESIKRFQWIPLVQQEEYFAIYKRQLELFAMPARVEFKPFAILKAITSDGTEKLFFDMKNSEQFNLISNEKCLVINLNENNAYSEAEKFFSQILEQELEGVVVKPEQPYIKGVAPYLKVRSESYLHLIYGLDFSFLPKYEKILKQKRIERKRQCSIEQYEYGKRMLEIPRSEISMQNKEYVNLFAKLIFEEKKEEQFDPRL